MDPSPKLNMNHGFLKSIVKNQIDRDEYHRLMEERKEEYKKEIRSNGGTSPRPANMSNGGGPVSGGSSKRSSQAQIPANVYVPPHRRRAGAGPDLSNDAPVQEIDRMSIASPSNKKAASSNTLVTEREESRIREKVRAQVRALGDINISAVKNASPATKEATKPLFQLNLAAGDETVEVTVLSTDNAARLAKELTRKYELTVQECRVLRETLDREIEARK